MIHETAIIHENAVIGKNANIGPYSVIGPNVKIGNNVDIKSHVVIDGDTTIGDNCEIFPFASIGMPPQDLKFHGEKSKLIIGHSNKIREYVTIQPGTESGRMETVVGNNCLFMASSHVAHDCIVGNHVIMANNATIAGHVTVEDFVIIGGLSAVHQFVRIGKHAIIGGMTAIARDVVPFASSFSEHDKISGVNLVGLKRNNFSSEQIRIIQKIFDILFFEKNDLTFQEKIKTVEEKFNNDESAKIILNFLNSESIRSFVTA